ncbi:MAG: SHD1 domain-containing protein [Verrucomicrobiota bacterium]
MKSLLLTLLIGCWTVAAAAPWSEPTELRAWTAKTGHKIDAKAVQIADGKVQLQRADGSKVSVDLDKFSDADQAILRKHFVQSGPATPNPPADAPASADSPAGADTPPPATGPTVKPTAGIAADDLPYPLGQATAEIPCGDAMSYFLYLPNSLRKGVKHPVLFVMGPGGGSAGDADRYRAGAERNHWIIAISKQSRNGFEGSQDAIDAMIRHVTTKLPINKKRMYVTGFSGGSRMAFATAGTNKEIAGVIACGAGGHLGSAHQVAYGLVGTNCFNRTDMSNCFKGFKGRDHVLRFFPGQHEWAAEELCDDAITHLNGVFLFSNRVAYPDDWAAYTSQVGDLVGQTAKTTPLRAYMWSSFLTAHGVTEPKLAALHATLSKSEINKLYEKGLTDVSEFAQKNFGGNSGSQWKADPKVAAACKREAKKFAGTPWEQVLNLMADDAQKF